MQKGQWDHQNPPCYLTTRCIRCLKNFFKGTSKDSISENAYHIDFYFPKILYEGAFSLLH